MADVDASTLDQATAATASRPLLRVVIAGGGIAGLEALLALRALADQRVELTLVAPDVEFAYRPVAAGVPFAVGRSRRIRLDRVARDANAGFVAGTVESVNTDEKLVRTSGSGALEYDALVLAVGAQPVSAIPRAMTWDDRSDSEMLGGLMQDFEHGYSRRLAVVVPPGPVWPLRAYELALVITMAARSMSVDIETTIVTPQPSPLAVLAAPALEQLILTELELAGVAVVCAAGVDVERGLPHTVVLHPSGRRLEVDRVLALPALRGRAIPGIPVQAHGLIEVDAHCRVRGLEGVWAIGDGTAFPLKAGGFAAEQADVAAQDVAATAGAVIQPRPFEPTGRGDLAGLPAGPFLESWLARGDDPAMGTHLSPAVLPMSMYLRHDLDAGRRGHV
ncbi:MAG: sulfide:quinone oxidoreductase [Solirubrobacteraceae bacterium]|nr:sulfide:quinone oxidoreductase [Solirubrobacteraceae bacterium]